MYHCASPDPRKRASTLLPGNVRSFAPSGPDPVRPALAGHLGSRSAAGARLHFGKPRAEGQSAQGRRLGGEAPFCHPGGQAGYSSTRIASSGQDSAASRAAASSDSGTGSCRTLATLSSPIWNTSGQMLSQTPQPMHFSGSTDTLTGRLPTGPNAGGMLSGGGKALAHPFAPYGKRSREY